MTSEPVPGSLAEALAALQGQLPHVAKTADARMVFTDHWAGCDLCQFGLPCREGDPLWKAMQQEASIDA